MDPISSWLISKGIALAESSVMSLLEFQDPENINSKQLDSALQRLDRLLGAPYESARLHLLGGETEKALDHLKDAIANQPLHLPARLLHIKLLLLEKRYVEALQNYWELLNAFSYREDLVPPFLYQAFLDQVARTPVRPGKAPVLQIREAGDGNASDCKPSVWCSPAAIGIEWPVTPPDQTMVTLDDWNGKRLLTSSPDKDALLEMLTSEYAVYREGDKTFRVFSLTERKELAESSLDESTFRALFLPPDRELQSTQLYRLTHFGPNQISSGRACFSNVILQAAAFEKQEEEYESGSDLYLGEGWSVLPYFTTVTVKWRTVECIARPLSEPASKLPLSEGRSVATLQSEPIEVE